MRSLPWQQHTLARPVEVVGVGLHSGQKVTLRLLPAPPDHGIVFERCDLAPPVRLAVHPEAVRETRLCTGLATGEVTVATVEHLLSALAALAIDNVLVQLDAPEVPIMDGSAAPFLMLLRQAGRVAQAKARRYVRVLEPVRVVEGDKWTELVPFDGFRVEFAIAFDHPAIAATPTTASFDWQQDDYEATVGRARTFGFVHEVEALRQMGLARGGSLDNAIVLDEHRVLNAGGLRREDEFVRHKILDAIGDLYVLGAPLLARYRAFKSGHALNNQLLRALLANAHAWRMETLRAVEAKNPVPSLPAATSFSLRRWLAGAP